MRSVFLVFFGTQKAIMDSLGKGDTYGPEHEIKEMLEAPGPISSRSTGCVHLHWREGLAPGPMERAAFLLHPLPEPTASLTVAAGLGHGLPASGLP